MKTQINILLSGVLLVLCGCSIYMPDGLSRNSVAGTATDAAAEASEIQKHNMSQDAGMLGVFSKEMRSVMFEFEQVAADISRSSSNTIAQAESDRIQALFFRYQVMRRSLVEISDRYSGRSLDAVRLPERHTTASLLGILARLLIRYNDTVLSAMFINEPLVRNKLNAGYSDAGISPGSFDRVRDSLLLFRNREMQEAARRLFTADLANPFSMLSQRVAVDSECAVLVRAIRSLYSRMGQSSRSLLAAKVATDSRYPVKVNSAKVAMLVENTRNRSTSDLDAAVTLDSRGLAQLAAAIVAPPLKLTAAQHKQLQSLVNPGDIILTYRKGYLTNLVFPGKFIHGLIYVGEAQDRVPAPDGSRLDLVEATGNGVIMNSLDFITGKHISRMAVLRPQISESESAVVMAKLSSYMGRDYDMAFDFVSDKKLCCTEVAYHLFDGIGGIDFKLKKRMGIKSLTADDIIRTALQSGSVIDVVCVLDEKGGRGRKAQLLTGDAAAKHLRKMLRVK